jgi:hypothetical protein
MEKELEPIYEQLKDSLDSVNKSKTETGVKARAAIGEFSKVLLTKYNYCASASTVENYLETQYQNNNFIYNSIKALEDNSLVDKGTINVLHAIRIDGNSYAHPEKGKSVEETRLIENIKNFAEYVKRYQFNERLNKKQTNTTEENNEYKYRCYKKAEYYLKCATKCGAENRRKYTNKAIAEFYYAENDGRFTSIDDLQDKLYKDERRFEDFCRIHVKRINGQLVYDNYFYKPGFSHNVKLESTTKKIIELMDIDRFYNGNGWPFDYSDRDVKEYYECTITETKQHSKNSKNKKAITKSVNKSMHYALKAMVELQTLDCSNDDKRKIKKIGIPARQLLYKSASNYEAKKMRHTYFEFKNEDLVNLKIYYKNVFKEDISLETLADAESNLDSWKEQQEHGFTSVGYIKQKCEINDYKDITLVTLETLKCWSIVMYLINKKYCNVTGVQRVEKQVKTYFLERKKKYAEKKALIDRYIQMCNEFGMNNKE